MFACLSSLSICFSHFVVVVAYLSSLMGCRHLATVWKFFFSLFQIPETELIHITAYLNADRRWGGESVGSSIALFYVNLIIL